MKKFETLKAGLGNGFILTLTEQGNAELNQYGEDVDTSQPHWLIGLDVESGNIAKLKNTFNGKRFKMDCDEDFFLPHLFPLSHLNKPIRVEGYNDGEEFVLIREIKLDFDHEYSWCMKWDHILKIIDSGKLQLLPDWIKGRMNLFHFNTEGLDESDYIDASESKVYEPK